jgi:predicted peptidase
MTKCIFLSLLSFLFVFVVSAVDDPLFERHVYISGVDSMPYRLLLPESYDTNNPYPLLIFLHGAGERGVDNVNQLRHGMSLFTRGDVRCEYPCIVLAPQCDVGDRWSNVIESRDSLGVREFAFQLGGAPTHAMSLAISLLHWTLSHYAIDVSRVYIGGISMGGMGTFELVRRVPGLFAGAFPICGGAHPLTASLLRDVSWWIFHGALDDVVPSHLSQSMFTSLQSAGASVGFTLYPHANHNSWDAAFADPELLKWLFSCRREM